MYKLTFQEIGTTETETRVFRSLQESLKYIEQWQFCFKSWKLQY
jgi:hypothetical protein